jgi:glycerol-3-phosphate acyltransferase PlsY
VGLIGVMALMGHVYPVFFGFQGGKGVATAFGVLLGVDWRLCAAALLAWAVVFAVTRVSSVASLLTFVLVMPVIAALYHHALLPALSLMGLLILWRHRQNIVDLFAGRERGFK